MCFGFVMICAECVLSDYFIITFTAALTFYIIKYCALIFNILISFKT